MKFNWGHGITIFLAIFLLSMAFVVYKGFQQKNALVEAEYYPKGLDYQHQIQRIRNADSLPEKIRVEAGKDLVRFTYPSIFKSDKVEGTIYFYRPSDDVGDETVAMAIDSTLVQSVPTGKLLEGKYILKFNWKMGVKEFYHEEALFISKK